MVLALVATNPASPMVLATKQQVSETIKTFHLNPTKKSAEIIHDYWQQIDCLSKRLGKERPSFHGMRDVLNRRMEERMNTKILPVGEVKLKTTVILTSVSLIGQW